MHGKTAAVPTVDSRIHRGRLFRHKRPTDHAI
jgi:hypothetical protein